jgi:hypothetical protein
VGKTPEIGTGLFGLLPTKRFGNGTYYTPVMSESNQDTLNQLLAPKEEPNIFIKLAVSTTVLDFDFE